MIEFRWVIFLTLWTLLIGPVLDLTQNAPTAPHSRAKESQLPKRKSAR